ncbi:hypothetical protein F5X68DRAFT_263255 [Plectosphaerella plurivora]|uniref:Uncharacterized protein n=1 Tax=Plectosphaerella plurivora TaxID=936078 RepID=A0A9P9A8U5_9PEZI|nr:hypothetical protein F5X68DRAFT_263255 [Plectosphaerella plurivora]
MKEEAKRQETETSLTASTTTSGVTPFNQEGGNAGSGQPQSTSPTPARDGSEGRASTTSSNTPEATALTVPAVEFFLDKSDAFFIERGRHLVKITGRPIAVPLNLHPGLGEGRGFQVDKHICAITQPDLIPSCTKVAEIPRGKPTGQKSEEGDVADDNLVFNTPPEAAPGSAYYLLVTWSKADIETPDDGFSYSTLFGVADDNTFFNAWNEPISFKEPESSSEQPVILGVAPGQNYTEAPSELIQALNNEDGRSVDIVPGVSSGTTPITSPSATNTAGGDGDVSDATASGTPGGGGGGLQKGAIIGIAVAASIVGLAAIGLLVWFFCLRNRRRRGTKDHGPYAAPDHQASEYMVNKETTGAHVTESPHSPYSDDGSLAHAQAQGPSSLAQTQQTNQYSDAPPIAAPVPRSASQQAGDRPESGAGTRSGTPGGHNVSHLIEEGMTEADIRRLEEEERALDDAIERAGHGRR